MAKIRYRRAGHHEPEDIEAHGKVFEHGKWVEVDDKVRDKARGNPSFEVEGETTHGDEEAKGKDRDDDTESEERKSRARVAQQGTEETRKAKQAEARGGSHRDERA